MIGKIILNNIISIGIHALLCLAMYLLLISPISVGHVGSIVLSIVYTIAFLFMYYLSGRLFLHNTHNIWMNLASVAALALGVVVGMLLARNRGGLVVINFPFYPLMLLSPKVVRFFPTVALCTISLLPSLAMWIGIITKRSPEI